MRIDSLIAALWIAFIRVQEHRHPINAAFGIFVVKENNICVVAVFDNLSESRLLPIDAVFRNCHVDAGAKQIISCRRLLFCGNWLSLFVQQWNWSRTIFVPAFKNAVDFVIDYLEVVAVKRNLSFPGLILTDQWVLGVLSRFVKASLDVLEYRDNIVVQK